MNHTSVAASQVVAVHKSVKIGCNCFEDCHRNDSLDCNLFRSLGAKVSFKRLFHPLTVRAAAIVGFFSRRLLILCFSLCKPNEKKRTCKWKLCEAIRLQPSVGQLYYFDSSSISIWKIYCICLYWIQGSNALFCQKPPMVDDSVFS